MKVGEIKKSMEKAALLEPKEKAKCEFQMDGRKPSTVSSGQQPIV